MLKIDDISRMRAFSIHLVISFLIFLVLLNVILFVWYPSFLFQTDGGWHGVGIIAGVDIVLGPMLTLIIFKPGKPGLKFDLIVIAVIQFVSLFLGSWVVYNQRPALLVFADDVFMTIPQETVKQTGLTDEKYKKFREGQLATVIVDLPVNQSERIAVLNESVARGGILLRGDLYIAYNNSTYKRIFDYSIVYDKLVENFNDKKTKINDFLDKHEMTLSETAFFPILVRYGNKSVIAVNRNTGQLIDVIDIAPPEIATSIKLNR